MKRLYPRERNAIITLYISALLLRKIDGKRGKEKRSPFICGILEKAMR